MSKRGTPGEVIEGRADWALVLGDCLGPEGLAVLPDKSVDHAITDPPFEVEAHTLQRRVKRGSTTGGGPYADSRIAALEPLPFAPMDEAGRRSAAGHIARVTRRWGLVFCQVEGSHLWVSALEGGGMNYRRTCIWVKPDGMPQYSGDRPGMGFETIVASHAPGKSRWNGRGRHGVFRTNKVGRLDRDRTGHPTQKPCELMETLVRLFTGQGEIVVDPYSGSGTTGVAAIRNGRRFIGWELDPTFYRMAEKRLSECWEQRDLLGSEGAA